MKDNWKAHIVFRPDMLRNAVYLTRSVHEGREYLLGTGDNYFAKHSEVPKKDPLFALLDDEQLQALTVALSESGRKAPDTHLVEGKLGATERHLEDMRRLVFDSPETTTLKPIKN